MSESTYELFYDNEHPPPGKRPDEPFTTALARLRRIILRHIPVLAVSAVTTYRNESSVKTGDINKRLCPFKINDTSMKIQDNRLYIDVTASDAPRTVTSSDIFMKVGDNKVTPPIVLGIPITVLPPGKGYKSILHLKTGTVNTDNSCFTIAPAVRFKPVGGDVYRFVITLATGFNDINYVMTVAAYIMNQQSLPAAPVRKEMEGPTQTPGGFINTGNAENVLS